jgi:hypothetical protein
MEERVYIIVYGDGDIFFFAIVSEIPSPKHHEIQEFTKNYHIASTVLLHYDIIIIESL